MKSIKITFLLIIFSSIKLFSASDYPNSIFLGLGVEQNITEKYAGFSLMAGYNKHIETTPEMSVGVLMEGVFGLHNSCVFGIPVGFYPVEKLKLYIAPCFVYGGGGSKYFEEKGDEYFRTNNQFMFRFGGGYSISFPNTRFSAMPFIEGSVVSSEFILGVGVKFNMSFTNDFR